MLPTSERTIILSAYNAYMMRTMASYTTSLTALVQIPLRRFAAQVFFSMLAVLIPGLLQKWDILPISGPVALICVAYADFALTFRNPIAKPRCPQYCVCLSMCLGYLHQATTAIGEYFLNPNSDFSQAQHVAVHFCLAFFIISEFEFYHAYIDFRNCESGFDALKYFLVVNVEHNHVFPISRDPWGFGYMTLSEGPNVEMFSKSTGLHVCQWLLFWIICWLGNFLLKRMVDPSSNDGKDLLCAISSTNVFFTTEDAFQLYLNLPLLRVVRQANHVGFWVVFGLVERWKARAEVDDESASYASSAANGQYHTHQQEENFKAYV